LQKIVRNTGWKGKRDKNGTELRLRSGEPVRQFDMMIACPVTGVALRARRRYDCKNRGAVWFSACIFAVAARTRSRCFQITRRSIVLYRTAMGIPTGPLQPARSRARGYHARYRRHHDEIENPLLSS